MNEREAFEQVHKKRKLVALLPSGNFQPSGGSWCVSQCDIETFHFEWNIKHFELRNGTNCESDVILVNGFEDFSLEIVGGDQREISVALKIYGRHDFTGSRIELHHTPKVYRVTTAIVNKKKEKVSAQEVFLPKNTVTPHVIFKVGKYLAFDSLQLDGSLTICYDIECVVDTKNVTGKLAAGVNDGCISCSDQLVGQLEELYESKKFSDVVINVGGREFQAHKNILATRSKVFAAMFEHQTTEKLSNNVVIEGIDPDVFQELLHFIYTGRMPLAKMEQMAIGLMAAADKYLLDQLKIECENHLIRQMSADDCLELLLLTDRNPPADDLKQAAVDFFRRSPGEVMATDGWKKAKKEFPVNHALWTFALDIMEKVYRPRSSAPSFIL
ncbi:speckle-type POZ protein B-like [Daphnia pulex]|uniref:speckle-type POZ protein B-like n=1 Tax=Daphnia pulex TaxID=6669 RepID=UPI001EDF8A25|nr:speckle-type POZ protein B-like [Daphnia pulex]